MNSLLLVAMLLQSPYDDPLDVPLPSPSADVKPDDSARMDAGAVVTLDSQPVAAPEAKRLIVYSMRSGCAPCAAMKADIGDGDEQLQIVWEYDQVPTWVRLFPTVYNPETNTYLSGRQALPVLRTWAGVPNTVAATAPITGSIKNISGLLDQYRSYVAGGTIQFREQTIDLGSVTLSLNSTECTLSESGAFIVAKFGSRKPSVRWGVVKLDVYGVKTDGKSVTVEVPGPDWTLKIEE